MTGDATEWAVHRLLHRYIAAVDGRDLDAIVACFGADGVFVLRDVERSGVVLAEFYREKLTVPTLHFVTGISVSERPDGLVGSTCGLYAIEMGEPGWHGVVGRYDDVIRLDGATATFARRELTIHQRVQLAPTR